mgnify:CR=1 FL=1
MEEEVWRTEDERIAVVVKEKVCICEFQRISARNKYINYKSLLLISWFCHSVLLIVSGIIIIIILIINHFHLPRPM